MNSDAENADRLIEIFNQAKIEPAGELREQFLVAACGANVNLRREVDELLRAHDEANSFLNANGGASSELQSEFARLKPEEPGDRIGHYKLLQQIGEGGFGTVWMAEQSEPVKRRVALKIIKLGMDTREVVARFEQERQALAMMDHPNIAKVFDAGATPTGRPFFVMELVRGIKITDYCDEQALSTRERVELFIRVCQAVQHAHQKGIIHRDLKPSNILVTINDGEAVPKVIDFGVAKATQGHLSAGTLFTRFEQMIGTPLYMSPEQAEMTSLDIDTRSDIYSLGVLLYELLTGRTPIDTSTMAQAGMDEIRRIIREVDPLKPSARLKTLEGNELTTTAKRRHTDASRLPAALRGDIDWIVMKCLEKDRKRRYDTANGLAADLQRHLRNEVIIARPPTTAYLLGKLIKRNKLAFAAAAAILVSLLIGMGATAWQLAQTRRALNDLRATAPAFVEQARALAAKERFDDAIKKLDYAIKLEPEAAEYLVAKGDLLQCQFKLSEAALVYREALRVKPGLARAEESAKLCEELLAAKPKEDGTLTRESLAKLHLAIQRQQRPAAEILPVARRLGEEKGILLSYWLERLKDLPISTDRPLKDRILIRDDGQLGLEFEKTKIADLSPLAGAPIAVLILSGCKELKDISPLSGLNLGALTLDDTGVSDLTPLREMTNLRILNVARSKVTDLSPLEGLKLKRLGLNGCPVRDIAPLRQMALDQITLNETRVADLTPLIGMPIKIIDLSHAPVIDFAPLAGLPLEKCYLQRNRITDLSILRGKQLKELVLWGCVEARNYAVLPEIETLELLLIPSEYRTLPDDDYAAIGKLRSHPKLRQIGSEIMNQMDYGATVSKEVFWQDWDREQSFLPALRASGVKFSLGKLPTGKYSLSSEGAAGLRDLSILRGAPISELHVSSCKISNLAPLSGLPLEVLGIAHNPVTDLSPLRGMPLKTLYIFGSNVSDLSPLEGMPLQFLQASGTKVVDVSVLRRLPLTSLRLHQCAALQDVSALADCKTLVTLTVPWHANNIETLRSLPNLRRLGYLEDQAYHPNQSVEEFWKVHDGWAAKLLKMDPKPELHRHADGSWEVRVNGSKLADLNFLRGLPINELFLGKSGISDLSPLRGMQLKKLEVWGDKITDLSPLTGMPLEKLSLGAPVTDISALRGMPLVTLRLQSCSLLTDLSPLADCKTLAAFTLPPNAKNFEFLRSLPGLKRLGFEEDNYQPKTTVAEFWKEYNEQAWVRALEKAGSKPLKADRRPDGTWSLDFRDVPMQNLELLRGIPISYLQLGGTGIKDLAPLRGMPLKRLYLYGTHVSDLSPLKGMKLTWLHAGGAPISDISVLRGMPLTGLRLHGCAQLTDLSPLADAKNLTELTIPPDAKNFEFLRAFPKLERLSYSEMTKRGGLPSKTAEEFWKEYDAKKAATGNADVKRPDSR